LNYCTSHRPCRNEAVCRNVGLGGYQCDCKPGFAGTNCEHEVVDCSAFPCYNGGTCLTNTTATVR